MKLHWTNIINGKIKNEQNWVKLLFSLFSLKKILFHDKRKKIILSGTPLHGNMGDHAIALAEYQLIKKILSNIEILEIPIPLMLRHPWVFKRMIGKNVILISGGGYLGSLWMDEEHMVRNIVKIYKRNKIIILPQTIFYENTIDGQREKEISSKLYSKHKNLTLFVREKSSYNQAHDIFNNNKTYSAPDMALFLQYEQFETNREGILFCFRKDKECIFSYKDKKHLYDLLGQYYNKEQIKETDTVVSRNIMPNERKLLLNRKLKEFSRSKIVITDRLHGMIFAAITSTPCIAINNKSKKIEGVYKLIKNNNYIKFLDNMNEIDETIEYLLSLNNIRYNNESLINNYARLKEYIAKSI